MTSLTSFLRANLLTRSYCGSTQGRGSGKSRCHGWWKGPILAEGAEVIARPRCVAGTGPQSTVRSPGCARPLRTQSPEATSSWIRSKARSHHGSGDCVRPRRAKDVPCTFLPCADHWIGGDCEAQMCCRDRPTKHRAVTRLHTSPPHHNPGARTSRPAMRTISLTLP